MLSHKRLHLKQQKRTEEDSRSEEWVEEFHNSEAERMLVQPHLDPKVSGDCYDTRHQTHHNTNTHKHPKDIAEVINKVGE